MLVLFIVWIELFRFEDEDGDEDEDEDVLWSITSIVFVTLKISFSDFMTVKTSLPSIITLSVWIGWMSITWLFWIVVCSIILVVKKSKKSFTYKNLKHHNYQPVLLEI